MQDAQGIVNLMLVVVLGLIPVALVTLIVGRWRSQRFVLKWAQAAGILSAALSTGYLLAGAACLILESRTPTPTYPLFLLPVGGVALALSLAILATTIRTRWRMG